MKDEAASGLSARFSRLSNKLPKTSGLTTVHVFYFIISASRESGLKFHMAAV